MVGRSGGGYLFSLLFLLQSATEEDRAKAAAWLPAAAADCGRGGDFLLLLFNSLASYRELTTGFLDEDTNTKENQQL